MSEKKWLSLLTSYRKDKRKPFGRSMIYFLKMRFTKAGQRLLLVTIIATAMTSAIGIIYPIYLIAIFLLSIFVSGRIVGFVFTPNITIERILPERVSTGSEMKISAKVTNIGRLPIFDLAVSESHPPDGIVLAEERKLIDCLGKKESCNLEYSLIARQRGVYDFTGPIALSLFPYGLFANTKKVSDNHRMLVYPTFRPLTNFELPAGNKHQPGGLQMTSSNGDSEEFLGNREYVTGDRLRDIDQKAWARVGTPIVREFQQEYLCRIALIVDTFLPNKTISNLDDKQNLTTNISNHFKQALPSFVDSKKYRTSDEVEAGISLGASIADALSRLEYVIDIFAAGPELYHFQAGRSLAHLDNILDVLACIEACSEDPFAKLGPALFEEISEISTAVIVMLDWDEVRENFVRSIQDVGVAVKLIIVKDGEPTIDPSGFRSEAGGAIILSTSDVNNGVGRL